MPAPASGSNSSLDPLLRTAIEQKRLIHLIYHGKKRIVEPHDYGIHKGIVKLLAYQIGGASSGPLPNWRWLELDFITTAELLPQTFAGGRVTSTGKHHDWDEVFIRVKSAL